jgi:hypothetical protein
MKRILVVLILLAMAGVGAFAQTDSDAHNVVITIAPIAALDLNDNTTDVVFTTSSPALAGNDPGPLVGAPATDVTKRLWYTAANLGSAVRTITVSTVTSAPAGTALTVLAAVEVGAGTTGGTIDIDTAGSAILVSAIPSVATGRGIGDGAGLTYSFWVSNPAALVVGVAPTTIVVTFTLTEDI